MLLIIILGITSLLSLTAQNINLFMYNGFEEEINFKVLYIPVDEDTYVTEHALLQPGTEHFFGTTNKAGYYMNCWKEGGENYLVETDIYYDNPAGYREYYATRKFSSDMQDHVMKAGTFKWREVVPGGIGGTGSYNIKRNAYLLNDTNLEVKFLLSDRNIYDKIKEQWITIQPGEKLYIGNDFHDDGSLYFYGTSESSSGTTYYYAGDTFVSITDPSNPDIKFYAAAARLTLYDNYSDNIYKLSDVERNDWVSNIEIDLSYNQEVAISYYDNGEWID
jgi:hypothetical protein